MEAVPLPEEMEKRLNAYEMMNLEENMKSKIRSLWEVIPEGIVNQKSMCLAVVRRFADLYFLLRVRNRQLG